VSDTNPNRDFGRWKSNIKRAIERIKEAKEKEKNGGGTFGAIGNVMEKFSNGFGDIFGLENDEDEKVPIQNIDYSYAGITDEVIRDVLDKNNDNVIQIDEYKIKIKVSNIHDNKYGSLYSIARYCYGSPYKWHIIAELNNIYEPTEIKEDQWLEIYSNEPISDFIVNSSSIDNLELQELKYLRKLKLQNLYKINDNEITVCNRPFIKGEFISYPKSLRSIQKKINFSKKYKTTLPRKKKFFIPKNKINNNKFNLAQKIIHSNEINLDNIIKTAAYINNGYLLSDYKEEYDDNTNTWKITLTIPQITDEDIQDDYLLSDYQSDNLYNVILTINEDEEISVINDDQYLLSQYEEHKMNNGDTEVILTILDKEKSKDIQERTTTVDITPVPIHYANDVDHSIEDQEQDPQDKRHPKHGISITNKRVKKQELPKNIPHRPPRDKSDDTSTDTGTPQHDIPPVPQPEQEGQVTDNLGPDNDYYRNTERAAKEKASHAKAVAQRINELGQSTIIPQAEDITESDLEQKTYDKATFRSQRTDLDIPVIPNEYVISFTLTDSDQEVYNYIEVGGSQAFAIQQGAAGSLPSIWRNIPDFEHIFQFGLRPHPVLQCSPLVQDANEAVYLGALLLYKSQLNRYSGVLTCIEDSAIKVGNPIRMYLYDEHPYPLARRFGSNGSLTEEQLRNTPPYFDEKYYKEQAVFYVESISRNIDIQNVSTMTLQLKNGRVMGMTNPADILSIFFDRYYESYQSRNYYVNRGNNTATVALHSTDLSGEIQAHLAAKKESNTKWWINKKKYDEEVAKAKERNKALEEQGINIPTESGVPSQTDDTEKTL